jgi:hypothetical protein
LRLLYLRRKNAVKEQQENSLTPPSISYRKWFENDLKLARFPLASIDMVAHTYWVKIIPEYRPA